MYQRSIIYNLREIPRRDFSIYKTTPTPSKWKGKLKRPHHLFLKPEFLKDHIVGAEFVPPPIHISRFDKPIIYGGAFSDRYTNRSFLSNYNPFEYPEYFTDEENQRRVYRNNPELGIYAYKYIDELSFLNSPYLKNFGEMCLKKSWYAKEVDKWKYWRHLLGELIGEYFKELAEVANDEDNERVMPSNPFNVPLIRNIQHKCNEILSRIKSNFEYDIADFW